MRLKRIKLVSIILLTPLVTLTVGLVEFNPNPRFVLPLSVVLAQSVDEQKAEADRLLRQGVEQFNTSKFEAALQSFGLWTKK